MSSAIHSKGRNHIGSAIPPPSLPPLNENHPGCGPSRCRGRYPLLLLLFVVAGESFPAGTEAIYSRKVAGADYFCGAS